MKNKIAIIGGGASGMIAAITAARNGAEVTILERTNRIGKKLLATGNGRCNLTNIQLNEKNLINMHGSNKKFLTNILKQFTVEETLEFFKGIGIAHKVEDGGKVFPMSDQSSSVLDVLRYELEDLGVEIICETEIIKINKVHNGFILICNKGIENFANNVILATGGMSSPNLGSNGSGYKLSKDLGHNIIKPLPALVQLKLKAIYLKAIKGVKFNGLASVLVNNQVLRTEEGEILFTEYGISGPPILQLSRSAVEALENKKDPIIQVDMFPDFEHEELIELIRERLSYQYNRPLDFSFIGLINKRLITVILKLANINDVKKSCYSVSNKEIEDIVHILKSWTFQIIGSQSWSNSQVTAGGIDVEGVSLQTLESKIQQGIYFAGELLDVDGDCGGFNLQWAWSSGYIAGLKASL